MLRCARNGGHNFGRRFRAAALIALALALALSVTGPARAASCTVAQLDWLKGTWRSDAKDGQSEERWTDAPGGLLLGSAWTVKDGKAVFGEIMTIEGGPGGLAMRLRHFSDSLNRDREGHDPPMLFLFSDCQPHSAVLDGQGPQAGERLTYRRVDDHRLLIIGDFIHNGKPDHQEFPLLKVEN